MRQQRVDDSASGNGKEVAIENGDGEWSAGAGRSQIDIPG